MAQALVRTATVADAAVVADVQRQVWQQAYAEILPARVLLADPDELATRWAERIESGGAVLLADEGSDPVGFAAVGATPDLDGVGELEILHVLPRWGRRGHGGRLIGTAADHLRRAGALTGRWWLTDLDQASARFARRVGWAPDGRARRWDTGEGIITEHCWTGGLDLMLV